MEFYNYLSLVKKYYKLTEEALKWRDKNRVSKTGQVLWN